jgi:hypothetical protein
LKRNPSAKLWDVEIIAVSVISAVFITSVFKHILKLFILFRIYNGYIKSAKGGIVWLFRIFQALIL